MTQTRTAILPVLVFLGSIGGAGTAAYVLFNVLRSAFPARERGPARLLHAPRYARWIAFALAAVISVGASALLAALSDADVLDAVDTALAAALSIVASQVLHGLQLSARVEGERP